MKGKPPRTANDNQELTVTEAAALLGKTRQAVLYAIGAGKLTARRMGKAGYLIRLADIDTAYREAQGGFVLLPTGPGHAGLLPNDK
ncbi:MAG: helix-turn-helix domain-containing protein [Treponematales bacterium]